MKQVTLREAKAQLSTLIAEAQAGQEIVIARAGRPIAKLVPYIAPEVRRRKPGAWKGKVKIMPGYYEADKEIEKLFYGE